MAGGRWSKRTAASSIETPQWSPGLMAGGSNCQEATQ